MKTSIRLFALSLLFTVVLNNVIAQKPEPVYSIVKQVKTHEWYVAQAGLWKKEIDKNPTDAPAWLNYYVSNRMVKLTGEPDKWMNEKDNVLQDLNSIIDKAGVSIPNSFEYNYMKWWNGGNDTELFPYLQKAYELNPDRPETYDDFVTYYEIRKMNDKRKEINEKWFKSNDVSPGILAFGYNMLMSTEKNSILITTGDNDTYPLWMLQDARGIRNDVHVVNINLLMIDDYRNKCFKEIGIPELSIEKKDLENPSELRVGIINHIIKNRGNYLVYFSVCMQPEFYQHIEKNLYNEGLAFRYSPDSYDNMALLKNNVENRFLMDDLSVKLHYDISESVVNQMNCNYIIGFITLYKHYKSSNDINQTEKLKNIILPIAEKAGMLESVNKYFTE